MHKLLNYIILGVSFDLGVYWQQYPWQLGELACKLRAWGSEMSQYVIFGNNICK